MINIIDSIKNRRSIYAIGKEKTVEVSKIEELVRDAVKYVPAAFNSGTQHAYLFLYEKSDRVWDITMEALRKVVPAENFKTTEDKINSFKAGFGTVIYYTDTNATQMLVDQFPPYAHNFPIWAQQENGMLQFIIWAGLEEMGLGVSLQHYTELIEEEIKKEFNIPENLKMVAQMPFGKKMAEADPKDYANAENRFQVIR